MSAEAPIYHKEPRTTLLAPHGYWKGTIWRRGKKEEVLGLRSHLVAKAASFEQQALTEEAQRIDAEPPKVLSPLEYLCAPGLMADTIERYGTLRSKIIDEGDAYSTWGEIKTAVQIAESRGMTKIIDVAFTPHFESIKMLYNKMKARIRNAEITVEFRYVEDILREKDVHKFSRDYIKRITNEDGSVTEIPVHIDHEHNHTAHLLDRLGKSRYDWIFRNLYERVIKRPALKLGVNPEKMEQIQREKRRKNFPKKEFIAPIDVYPVDGKRAETPLVPTLLKINSMFRRIKAKIHPEPEKVKPANMGRVEIFPAGPVRRTN